jgi:Mn2+/Fe2+ NRAMP family transporter
MTPDQSPLSSEDSKIKDGPAMSHIDNLETLTPAAEAVLDPAHLGDITGALGTLKANDTTPRRGLWSRLGALLAVLGPGLIVMIGDNDAGGVATYTQAGQNYGTTLLWTLLALIPVLYVNQEMAARLGAVTGVGHGRLIFERFGRFWGMFSIIDLFLLNALTIVTEFIGISLALDYFGLPKTAGVIVAALLLLAVSTGTFRNFERFAVFLCALSLVFVPIFAYVHPPVADLAKGLFIPRLPEGKLSDVLLLVIGIIGTTVAPWQLFFQQSYVVDKRLRPQHMGYERADMWVGIVISQVVGSVAMMGLAAAAFAGTKEFGNFTDAGGVAAGLAKYVGTWAGDLFAIGLIDAALLGAAAVSLSTAYAFGDVFSLRHSLHRKVGDAIGFYLVYGGLIVLSAALVLIPNAPLGLVTEAVQVLAGILLPAATVFLLLLCNDDAVLGPWVNGRWTNLVTGLIIAVLLVFSFIMTVSVIFPDITDQEIVWTLEGGAGLALLAFGLTRLFRDRRTDPARAARLAADRRTWRMPPLATLPPIRLSGAQKAWLVALRAYLVVSCLAVIVRVTLMALGH